MGLVVNENASSLASVHRQLRVTQSLNSNVARLSSGSRINDAGDDAAGLGIAERLKQRVDRSARGRPEEVLSTRGIERYRAIAALREGSSGNIRDTDYGFESASMSEQQKKQQAGISVLRKAEEVQQEPLSLRL